MNNNSTYQLNELGESYSQVECNLNQVLGPLRKENVVAMEVEVDPIVMENWPIEDSAFINDNNDDSEKDVEVLKCSVNGQEPLISNKNDEDHDLMLD